MEDPLEESVAAAVLSPLVSTPLDVVDGDVPDDVVEVSALSPGESAEHAAASNGASSAQVLIPGSWHARIAPHKKTPEPARKDLRGCGSVLACACPFVDNYDKAALLTLLGTGAGAHPDIGGTAWQGGWDSQLPADAATLRDELTCDSTETWARKTGCTPGATRTPRQPPPTTSPRTTHRL